GSGRHRRHRRRPPDRDRILRQGWAAGGRRRRSAARPHPSADGRRDGGLSAGGLEQTAGRAVDAALAAGADDAEAWVERAVEREIRVYEGAVESLTDATSNGIGIRTFKDGRWGYAYGTDLSDDGLRTLAEASAGAARVADPD